MKNSLTNLQDSWNSESALPKHVYWRNFFSRLSRLVHFPTTTKCVLCLKFAFLDFRKADQPTKFTVRISSATSLGWSAFPKMNVSVFDQNLNFKFPKVLLPNTLSEEISSADSPGWSAFQDSNFAWTSMSKIHWFIKANLQLKNFRKCSSQTHSLKKFLQQLFQVGPLSWNWFYLKFQRRSNQLMESKQWSKLNPSSGRTSIGSSKRIKPGTLDWRVWTSMKLSMRKEKCSFSHREFPQHLPPKVPLHKPIPTSSGWGIDRSKGTSSLQPS